MVRILDRNDSPGFAERLGRSLINVGREAPSAFKGFQDYRDSQERKKAAESAALEKRIKGARKFGDEYLERFHPGVYENEKSYNSFSDKLKQYVNAGYSDDQAVKAALHDAQSQRDIKSKSGIIEKPKTTRGTSDSDKLVGGAFGSFIDALKEGKQSLEENAPARLERDKDKSFLDKFVEFNKGLGRSASRQAKEIAERPGRELAALGSHTLGTLASFAPDVIESGLRAGGAISPESEPNFIRKNLNKLEDWIREGRSPEDLKSLEKREIAYGLGLTPAVTKGVGLASKALKGAKGISTAETLAEEVAPAIGGKNASRLAEGVVSREIPGTATVARLKRLAPEGKLFKRAEQEAVREQQLKMFPKYAEEIASDAAERAARMEAKMPKTAVGEAGVAKRMAVAEAELPKAKDLYQKAIARVRGLEQPLAKGVPLQQQKAAEALYDMAVKELNDAEFYLKTVVNNAKTGEARVGLEQMRQAARNKILRFEDEVLSGHEPKLKLNDYNPETIKKAKALEKKKAIPVSKHEDYFTQVHEGYANEYRARIADLDREIEKLKRVPGMAPLQRGLQINREKDVLKKLVDHIEAENLIHRHKMGLRETAQRQVAKERLGQYTKQAGEQRVKDLAKEALQSPEKAAEATEVAFEEAAAEAKSQEERDALLREKGGVRNGMEQIASKERIPEPVPGTPEQAKKSSFKIVRDVKEALDSLKGKGPSFFKTRIGQDLLFGVGGQLIGEMVDELDLPVTQSAIISATFGHPRGAGYRYLVGLVTKSLLNKAKKQNYKNALESGDDEKLIELRKKYPKKVVKEAIEEYRNSASLSGF